MLVEKIAAIALALVMSSTVAADNSLKLEAAARGAHRAVEDIARNGWRHPVETLQFFGIRDDMTVVEVWPGGRGWYTEVLAPYLRENGKLVAANYDGSTGREYYTRNAAAFLQKLADAPEVYDRVVSAVLMPPNLVTPVAPGSADIVLTFRNLHNWVRADMHEVMLEAMHSLLKPGGVLGLVAHRGNADMLGAEWAQKGYVAEAEAIRMAEAVGFKFVAKSEVNANPKDTKDYADGVWTLPPSYRQGETDKEKYQAIGESDRMTLKFIKAQ